ncbi:MAG TPA: class I SAM-dependent methyltransferase [Chloroflexota bacterium]|jgi:SAM-dependent methyltransferase|nr:class I SAM-dependent methyltransferase [Chloroflexota bacterium]
MAVAQFAREYQTVRRAEGWGSLDGAYYRALPYKDLSGRHAEIWRVRARSFDTFLRAVVEPLEAVRTRLRVLDLGAGTGWLAYRLARRGHAAVAVDILDDGLDGLGARRHYAGLIAPLLAEFDRLPVDAGKVDLIVFNASLHYSTDYATTLREALRALRPGGTLVILDTPMYVDPTSGARMVQEREARFLQTYGFASNALPSEHFLTRQRLDQLARDLNIAWQVHQPRWPLTSAVRRAVNGLRARREPAHFPVIVGRSR